MGQTVAGLNKERRVVSCRVALRRVAEGGDALVRFFLLPR